jgi:hypothetical protein
MANTKAGATYSKLRDLKESEKLAPQAKEILNILGEGDKTRAELLDAMKARVTTQQPIERILAYYQKTMVDAGLIKVTAPEPEPPKELTDEEKAAAEKAAAGSGKKGKKNKKSDAPTPAQGVEEVPAAAASAEAPAGQAPTA